MVSVKLFLQLPNTPDPIPTGNVSTVTLPLQRIAEPVTVTLDRPQISQIAAAAVVPAAERNLLARVFASDTGNSIRSTRSATRSQSRTLPTTSTFANSPDSAHEARVQYPVSEDESQWSEEGVVVVYDGPSRPTSSVIERSTPRDQRRAPIVIHQDDSNDSDGFEWECPVNTIFLNDRIWLFCGFWLCIE